MENFIFARVFISILNFLKFAFGIKIILLMKVWKSLILWNLIF